MPEQQTIQKLSQLETPTRRLPYAWQDHALYALGVGAGPEEALYWRADILRPLPTFGVLPYWGAVGTQPALSRPAPTPVLAQELLPDGAAFVNLDYRLVLHKPLPAEGIFRYQDRVAGVYDRGEGRGLALRSCLPVYADDTGELLCTNTCTTLFPTQGGFGGEQLPAWPHSIPDRAPDMTLSADTWTNQHLLYRLTGDTNPVHCQPETTQAMGLKAPFLHDLCLFGYACRLAIAALLPGAPERLQEIAAQMRNILYPGEGMQLSLWKTGARTAAFRLTERASGKTLLDRGYLSWRD